MKRVSPIVMGATTAALAVVAQAFLNLYPPPAYGICIVCHGRDLIVWLVAAVAGVKPEVAAVSTQWPLFTVVGVLLGSRYAAVQYGEYKSHWVGGKWAAFLCGMAVMILGLIVMGCPARLLLRAAYGDAIGAAAELAVLLGVVSATLVMRWRIKKC
jgi:hypothetical protein